ncbi:TPA: hypothetical protein N0F65_011048 [Lagenidium giganteum]|uniref:Uncharacterized protein n=1 Tax=Lagenidium giganteum TaxID=4803 RepID=A0AAV2ZF45_9STRA|nr:TPA: hypothetical protein N0F65_011048 [Lagenidium giganteum]
MTSCRNLKIFDMEEAFAAYFESSLSAASLAPIEDADEFRAQILRQWRECGVEEGTERSCPSTCAHHLLGFCGMSIIKQLSSVLISWNETHENPVSSWPCAIDGVTEDLTNVARIRAIGVACVAELVDAVYKAKDDPAAAFSSIASFVTTIGGARGLLTLMGFRQTVGSRTLVPLTRAQCIKAFQQTHGRVQLTVGAKAFSKHCQRSADGWWGTIKGNDIAKNAVALQKLLEILDSAVWKNIHSLPHAQATMEVRTAEGYGARWYVHDRSFRGFLEPHMPNGHDVGWPVVSSKRQREPEVANYTQPRMFIFPSMSPAAVCSAVMTRDRVVFVCAAVLLALLGADASDEDWWCVDVLSDVDIAAGVGAVQDSTCASLREPDCLAGTNTTCRLCRKWENEQTKFYRACPYKASSHHLESAVNCDASLSDGDRLVGVSVYYDSICVSSGGVGCVSTSGCRFCQARLTPQSSPYIACPKSPTPTPTTSSPPTATMSMDAICASKVMTSRLPSISYVINQDCVSKPTVCGCVAMTACQLCRTQKTEANQFLVSCQTLGKSPATTMPVQQLAVIPSNDVPEGDLEPTEVKTSIREDANFSLTVAGCLGIVVAAVLAGISLRRAKRRNEVQRGSLVKVMRSESLAEL